MIYFATAYGAWADALHPHIRASGGSNPPIGNSPLNPPINSYSRWNPPINNSSRWNPPIRGPHALNPPIRGPHALNPPIDTGGDALNPPIIPSGDRSQAYGAYGWPWLGTEASWAYMDPMALQAQALEKVRSRIVRTEDPREAKSRPPAGSPRNAPPAAQRAQPRALSPVWRWQPPFRVKAAVCELMGHLRHDDLRVTWLPTGKRASKPVRLMDIVPPGPKFNYSDQIDKVLRAAIERQDRLPEILTQADDISRFFDAVTGFDPIMAPRTRELLEAAWEATTLIVMGLKNRIAELRPFQRSDSIVPVIPTPGHGSLPSGHATMATVTSELLIALRYSSQGDVERVDQLDRLVRRIAFNRVVAGVHFPMDSYVGYELGRVIAAAMRSAGSGEKLPKRHRIAVNRISELREDEAGYYWLPTEGGAQQPLPVFGALWDAATTELQQLRV